MELNALLQERGKVYDQLKALQNKYSDKPMESADADTYGNLEKAFDELTTKIDAAKKVLERDRVMGEKDPEPLEDKKDKISGAFSDCLRGGGAEAAKVYNSLSQTDPSQAGYLVAPMKFVKDLIAELDNDLFFRKLAKKFQLKGAQSLGFPKRTARMNSAAWGTEIGAPTPDSSLAFGRREFVPNFLTAESLLSRTLLKNAPEIDGIVRAEIARDVGELLENAYMTGDGANKPLGIFTASADGIPTTRDVSADNTTTAITFDGLINAQYSIKAQYQKNLSWIFHRDAIKMLRKIKDSNGQYIWQPSVVAGTPDRILDKTVHVSEYAPNTFMAGNYVGIIGDFDKYWICDGMDLEVLVLKELYARSNQIDYVARMSTDGMPVLDECFARVKLAAS